MSFKQESQPKTTFTIYKARKPKRKNPQVEVLRKYYQHHIASEMLRNPWITQQELAKSLHTSTGTIQRNVNALKENCVIQRVGGKRFGFWTVVEAEIPEETEPVELCVNKEKKSDESE